jgi:hypothetical protein
MGKPSDLPEIFPAAVSINNGFTLHPLIEFFSSILLIDLSCVIALFWNAKIVRCSFLVHE